MARKKNQSSAKDFLDETQEQSEAPESESAEGSAASQDASEPEADAVSEKPAKVSKHAGVPRKFHKFIK